MTRVGIVKNGELSMWGYFSHPRQKPNETRALVKSAENKITGLPLSTVSGALVLVEHQCPALF